VEDVLRLRRVGVVIEAMHFCMLRGLQKELSRTVMSALRGYHRASGHPKLARFVMKVEHTRGHNYEDEDA
jgi:GTP cyclohydrolase I